VLCLLAGVGLGASLVLGQLWRVPPFPLPSEPAPPLTMQEAWSVHEVAPPWLPPEAGEGAAPPRVDIPAPVTPVTSSKGEPHVKKKQKSPDPRVDEEKKASGSTVAGWCLGAAAAANLACHGAQVRTVPVPQQCPAGAVQTMTETLGLRLGEREPTAYFAYITGRPALIDVRQGPASLTLAGDWGNLPNKTLFFGQLYFGDKRVYGRITEARTPSGETFPVCMELSDTSGGRGLIIRSSSGDAFTVGAIVHVVPVDHFE